MRYRFDTRCVHGTPERAYEDGARSVSFPIYQSATFAHTRIEHGQFNYTRQDNPTRLRLEETIAALEQRLKRLKKEVCLRGEERAIA